MEKIWLKHYVAGVPAEINPDEFTSIVDVFDKSCAQYGDKPAFTNMGHSITFKELDKLTAQFASFLQHHCGLTSGDHIAIQMPNLLQYPVALLGALRLGVVVVNTNPLYTPREMLHQFNDGDVKAIVATKNYANHLEQVLPQTQIKHVVLTEIGDMFPLGKRLLTNAVVRYVKKMVPEFHIPQAISFRRAMALGAQQAANFPPVKNEDLAFVQYTGGTTGVAKGAMLTHRNIVANMLQMSAVMEPGIEKMKSEIIITPLPLYHIYALTVNLMLALKHGAQNVLITDPRNMKGFLKEINHYPFTMMTGVNTLYNGMLNDPNLAKVNFKFLTIASAGGMALQRAVAERWKQAVGVDIIEGYGMTETSPVTFTNPIGGEVRLGTIGIPVPSTDVRIIDENDQDVAQGERGELCVKGPQVMKGYWKREDENEKVFFGDGWLRTGDIATMDVDGYFRIVDRKKDMISVSGFKVFPNELEDVIAMNPKVKEVAIVGVPNDKTGETVKAYIVKKDPSLTEEELMKYFRENFVNYKVPHHVEFRDSLPKSNVGKILRRPLKEEAIAQLQAQAKAPAANA